MRARPRYTVRPAPAHPPEAGLLTARAHTPPDARAVTYIYRRAERVIRPKRQNVLFCGVSG